MEEVWKSGRVIAHAFCLARSLRHWTGRELLGDHLAPADFPRAVYEAPFVLVSHGNEADPVLNYGNRAALDLWEMTWEEFTRTPSRLTAEASDRDERARLLQAVTERGFMDDYCGVRISKTGRRFRIRRATVWNVLTAEQRICGQAACFTEWQFL